MAPLGRGLTSGLAALIILATTRAAQGLTVAPAPGSLVLSNMEPTLPTPLRIEPLLPNMPAPWTEEPEPEGEPEPEPEPEPEESVEVPLVTPLLSECGSCDGCLGRNGVCYPETKEHCDRYPVFTWCGASAETVPVPSVGNGLSISTPRPSSLEGVSLLQIAATLAPSHAECGSCKGCLANGICYPETQDYCDLYPMFTWCGDSIQVNSLLQIAPAPASSEEECGSCKGCLANGFCYPETQEYCDLNPTFTWCGEAAHVNLLRRTSIKNMFLEANRWSQPGGGRPMYSITGAPQAKSVESHNA